MEPEIALLSPWIKPHSPDGLVYELKAEVTPGHPLHAKTVRALAVARDRDDVLFAIQDDAGMRYAVVHLTWSQKPEKDVRWPRTKLFDTLESWIEWMKEDHLDYTWGEANPEQDANSQK